MARPQNDVLGLSIRIQSAQAEQATRNIATAFTTTTQSLRALSSQFQASSINVNELGGAFGRGILQIRAMQKTIAQQERNAAQLSKTTKELAIAEEQIIIPLNSTRQASAALNIRLIKLREEKARLTKEVNRFRREMGKGVGQLNLMQSALAGAARQMAQMQQTGAKNSAQSLQYAASLETISQELAQVNGLTGQAAKNQALIVESTKQASAHYRQLGRELALTEQQTREYNEQIKQQNKQMSLFNIRHGQKTVEGLNIVGSASAGLMVGMSALEGNVMGVAFGLIFLRFSLLPIVGIFAAATILVGLWAKRLSEIEARAKTLETVGNQALFMGASFEESEEAMKVAAEVAGQFFTGLDKPKERLEDLGKAMSLLVASGIIPSKDELSRIVQVAFASGRSIEDVTKAFVSLIKPTDITIGSFDDFKNSLQAILPASVLFEDGTINGTVAIADMFAEVAGVLDPMERFRIIQEQIGSSWEELTAVSKPLETNMGSLLDLLMGGETRLSDLTQAAFEAGKEVSGVATALEEISDATKLEAWEKAFLALVGTEGSPAKAREAVIAFLTQEGLPKESILAFVEDLPTNIQGIIDKVTDLRPELENQLNQVRDFFTTYQGVTMDVLLRLETTKTQIETVTASIETALRALKSAQTKQKNIRITQKQIGFSWEELLPKQRNIGALGVSEGMIFIPGEGFVPVSAIKNPAIVFSKALTRDILEGSLATGGIVRKPTLRLLGEDGPEAVIPLNRGGGIGGSLTVDLRGATFLNEEVPKQLVDAIARALGKSLSTTSGLSVTTRR